MVWMVIPMSDIVPASSRKPFDCREEDNESMRDVEDDTLLEKEEAV